VFSHVHGMRLPQDIAEAEHLIAVSDSTCEFLKPLSY
jgi:hypothetical protein